jgi:hypothetical protein
VMRCILVSAFVGWYIDCKNMHGMSKIGFLERSIVCELGSFDYHVFSERNKNHVAVKLTYP